jgi:hypothetical protein
MPHQVYSGGGRSVRVEMVDDVSHLSGEFSTYSWNFPPEQQEQLRVLLQQSADTNADYYPN